MLDLKLSPEIETRLQALARKTGRSDSLHAREAILAYLDDWEDAAIARERLERGGERVSLEVLEREAGGKTAS